LKKICNCTIIITFGKNMPFMTRNLLLMPALLACCTFFTNDLKAQKVYTLAGTGVQGYAGEDSVATDIAVKINTPSQIAIDTAGNIIFADKNNAVVRRVNMRTGRIRTIAGNGTAGYSGDGGAATAAQLRAPVGVAVDDTGSIFISDLASQTIRRVTPLGVISTYAGVDNTPGFTGDGGPAAAANFHNPFYITVDKNRNLYIADTTNNLIRKIDPTGTISTVAGSGTAGYSGDGGPATAARLHWPTSVAADTLGNLYIMDSRNNAVRKVNSSGIITSIAGNPSIGAVSWGYTGDGGQATSAQLNYPIDLAVDKYGNVFIADINNDAIRMVTADGRIKTVAGCHVRGFNHDSNLATNTQFYAITAVKERNGILYISDSGNSRVRYMSLMKLGITETAFNDGNISLSPNPNGGNFVISGRTTGQHVTMSVMDYSGKAILADKVEINNGAYKKQVNLDKNLPPGMYFIKVISEAGISAVSFIKD
jgi:trimeric autotransporter adhesin